MLRWMLTCANIIASQTIKLPTTMSAVGGGAGLLTLNNVAGLGGRRNTLLVTLGKNVDATTTNLAQLPVVVYFGGDVQNTQAKMEGAYDGYIRDLYSYESILAKLRERFEDSSIILVAPAKHVDGFAHYENFFNTVDNYGTPEYLFNDAGPVKHLVELVRNGQKQYASIRKLRSTQTGVEQRLILVGFSKGCTVVNQLLISASSAGAIDSMKDFKLDEVILLDSGHCGHAGAYINDTKHLVRFESRQPLFRLASIGATHYELRKTWINKELPRFVEQLEGLGVRVKQATFAGGNLRDHFEVHNALWSRQLGH